MKPCNVTNLILMLLCILASSGMAQERTPKTPEERATALTDWMKTNLELSTDQEAPIQDVNLKYANLNEELKTSTKSKMQKFKTLKSNDESKDKELKDILTPDQFKIYEAKKDEIKEKFKEEAQKRRKDNG